MLGLRLLSPQLDITFGAMLDVVASIDIVTTFVVGTAFNVVLTFFVTSAYLDRLCEHLFATRGVNIGIFHGRFRHKVGFAADLRVLRRHDPAGRRHRELQRASADPRVGTGCRGIADRRRDHLLLDHAGADPADRASRLRHAPRRQERPGDTPAGDVGRRDGPRGQSLQRHGRGPVGTRVPARHVRKVRERERRHRHPAQRTAHGPRRPTPPPRPR